MISSQSRNHGAPVLPHKEITTLDVMEEYVGILRNVEKRDGMTILEFDKGCVGFYKELEFEKYIGKRIGVLRANIEEREVVVIEYKNKTQRGLKEIPSSRIFVEDSRTTTTS